MHHPRSKSGKVHVEVVDGRRSRSSQPYHAVSEVYSKEISHRPIGSVDDFPPHVIEILKEQPRSVSPPLIRSRENTWTTENYPIIRVPSAEFTDIMTELYDYQEIEKNIRRSASPEQAILKKQGPPTYQVIPPTPEKNTPRHPQGIPLTSSSEKPKKALPMYEEYVSTLRRRQNSEDVENRNILEDKKYKNLRHIDSSASSEISEDVKLDDVNSKKRHVYTHDVFVDSATGRPLTPGRKDLNKEECGKLKINVYFKPPRPPVVATYELDEIEIEQKQTKKEEKKLRPLSDGISGGHRSPEFHRFPNIRTSILRKEHEIVTLPLNRSQSARFSREDAERPSSKSSQERPIPIQVSSNPPSSINLDDIFPKMPSRQQEVSTPVLPYTRGISKTPSVRESRADNRSIRTSKSGLPVYGNVDKERYERSASFVSSCRTHSHQSHKSLERDPSEVHIPYNHPEHLEEKEKTILPLYENRKVNRESPEELDYGKYPPNHPHFPANHPRERPTPELPYTRGISKTPSDLDYKRVSKVPSTVSSYHIPINVDKRTQKSSPSERSSYRTPSRTQNNTTQTQIPKPPTPVLPYTRGISKTPSDQSRAPSEKAPSVYERTHPAHSPSGKSRQSRPGQYEEIVHIKERYEKDETIRRFYPTTTSV